jgi:hypothetical protein
LEPKNVSILSTSNWAWRTLSPPLGEERHRQIASSDGIPLWRVQTAQADGITIVIEPINTRDTFRASFWPPGRRAGDLRGGRRAEAGAVRLLPQSSKAISR